MKKVRVDIKVETGVRYVSGFIPNKTKGLFAAFSQSNYDSKLEGWSITHRNTGLKVSSTLDLKRALALIMVLENDPRASVLWGHGYAELMRMSDSLHALAVNAAIKVEKALDEREKAELPRVPLTEPEA
jgi:hypothetical protein